MIKCSGPTYVVIPVENDQKRAHSGRHVEQTGVRKHIRLQSPGAIVQTYVIDHFL
jgi:hypothetical protein